MIEKSAIVESLEALAHETRLEIFLLLVQAGPDGVAAGDLAEQLGIARNALSFHLNRLRNASLVHSRRRGKQIIYAADFTRMEGLLAFLGDNCCRDSARACSPACPGQRAGPAGGTVPESAGEA